MNTVRNRRGISAAEAKLLELKLNKQVIFTNQADALYGQVGEFAGATKTGARVSIKLPSVTDDPDDTTTVTRALKNVEAYNEHNEHIRVYTPAYQANDDSSDGTIDLTDHQCKFYPPNNRR